MAPPLLARFKNGLLYRFIRGRVTTPDDLTRQAVWRGVARRLGQWHAILPINVNLDASTSKEDESSSEADVQPKKRKRAITDVRTQGPNLWTVTAKWIAALPSATEQQKARNSRLQVELERIRGELDDGQGLGETGVRRAIPMTKENDI